SSCITIPSSAGLPYLAAETAVRCGVWGCSYDAPAHARRCHDLRASARPCPLSTGAWPVDRPTYDVVPEAREGLFHGNHRLRVKRRRRGVGAPLDQGPIVPLIRACHADTRRRIGA